MNHKRKTIKFFFFFFIVSLMRSHYSRCVWNVFQPKNLSQKNYQNLKFFLWFSLFMPLKKMKKKGLYNVQTQSKSCHGLELIHDIVLNLILDINFERDYAKTFQYLNKNRATNFDINFEPISTIKYLSVLIFLL